MKTIPITAFELAMRFIGEKEGPGHAANPQVLAMLGLDGAKVEDDDVPWCSAFVNYITWLLRLPRSKSLAARSWLQVGSEVHVRNAVVGFDVVVLKRGEGEQPGAEVVNAPGHVGFFAGYSEGARTISLLGGNQGDAVNVHTFPVERVLSVRRLYGDL